MGKKGIIFDIKRFAVEDGPGIRTTVFLKRLSPADASGAITLKAGQARLS